MDSNLQDRIDLLHQQAAGFYLQGEFQDALQAWRELLQLDGEDERAQEGVRLCEMLADENVQHQSIQDLMASPAPPVASDAESSADAVMLGAIPARGADELDALEQLLDDHLGMGGDAPPIEASAATLSDESFDSLNDFESDDEVPSWKVDPEYEPLVDPSQEPELSMAQPESFEQPKPASVESNGLRPELDASEAAAAGRAAEAEVQRRILELMAEVRSAIDAHDTVHALKVVRRVLILDDTNVEALQIRTNLEGGPVESFSAGSPDFSGDVGLPSMMDSEALPSFEATGFGAAAPLDPAPEPSPDSAFEATSFVAPEAPPEEDLLAGVSFEDNPAHAEPAMPSFGDEPGGDIAGSGELVDTPPLHGAAPIGQEGELPPGVDGLNLAADPGGLRSRNDDAIREMREDAAQDADSFGEGDDDDGKHAALNKAAAKLAKIKADDAANVSVRRLSRGLVMGLMAAVILAVVAVVGIKAIDGFGADDAAPLTPPPATAKDNAKGKKQGSDDANAAVAATAPATTQADVDRWLGQAAQMTAQENFVEAIRLYDRVLKARPEHPVAKGAIQLAASNFQTQQTLVRKELEAFRSFERGDYRSALRAFYRLPAETGKNYDRQIANGWHNMGIVALQNGNCSGATEAFRELRAAKPSDPALASTAAVVAACPTNQGGPAFLRAVSTLTLRRADD